MSATKFKEIETKYRVTNLSLSAFMKLAKSLNPKSYIEAAGYDYYYVNENGDAIRYRAGTLHELTVKKKTSDKNNFVRREVNQPIKPKSLDTVEAFCDMLGYKLNFSIFKVCFIYYFENFDLVYYVLQDDNLHEIDRFLEIEMFEDYPWISEDQAWTELLKVEAELKPLGITKANRIKKSLFEMFKK